MTRLMRLLAFSVGLLTKKRRARCVPPFGYGVGRFSRLFSGDYLDGADVDLARFGGFGAEGAEVGNGECYFGGVAGPCDGFVASGLCGVDFASGGCELAIAFAVGGVVDGEYDFRHFRTADCE